MWRFLLLLTVLIPRTIYSYVVIFLFYRNQPYSEKINELMRTWCRLILNISGVKVRVKGTENLVKDTSFILMANHQSAFDIPVLGANVQATVRFMSKKENFKIPVLGKAMKWAGIASIDRQNRDRAIESIKELIDVLKQQKLGVIGFPEGTRTPDGTVSRFKKGLFVMAIDGQIPIIPVSISGAFAICKKKSVRIRPGVVHLTIHPPINMTKYSHNTRDQLIENVREIIKSAVILKSGEADESSQS